MTQDIFYKILSDHKELASLPQVLVEVLRVSSDANSSASDLAAVIMKDPALTAKLLRVVNSPYYGPIRKITTINQAVVTLGQRTVTAVALSTSVYDKINRVDSAIDRKRFWRHSLEVAIAARMVAHEASYEPVEEAFVAGLLHEIGTLVLEASFPTDFKRVWKLVELGESQIAVEERTWGTNHARVGQFLLEQWGVPKVISEAIAGHHTVIDYGEKSPDKQLVQIINLANQISKFRVYNMPPPESAMLENKDIIAANLGLSNAILAGIEEKLISEIIRESGFLEIEVGNIEEILNEANKLLYKQFLIVENLLRENRIMQQQIAHDQTKKAALESLKTIAATFSHYINNATTAILGRAQLVEMAISRGEVIDEKGIAALSSQTIVDAVEAISTVIEELKKMTTFETTLYHEDTYLVDMDERIRAQLAKLNKPKISVGI
jgi:putative nucleotidyltransferase with HDIG domain